MLLMPQTQKHILAKIYSLFTLSMIAHFATIACMHVPNGREVQTTAAAAAQRFIVRPTVTIVIDINYV